MNNQAIAKLLREIAASYSIKNEEKFRFQIIAYERAADAIENSSIELKELFEEGKLDSIPGIGTTIKSHLEELFKTGKVRHFDWVKQSIPKAVFVLMDVPSFGPKKSYRLIQEFSLNNPKTAIGDLKTLATEGKIAKIEGFGEKSQADILRAISDFQQGIGKNMRMTLPYAYEIANRIVSYMKICKDVLKIEPLGSLRRMAPTIGDIDIAIATDKPRNVINHFINYPQIERVIEKGETSSSIIVSGDREIDLMTMPVDSFGSLLQHLTGSKNHNVHLREYAVKKNLSLSEYGIRKKINGKEKIQKYDSEEKFYKALNLDWIPPELREDTGEIEAALTHKLPKLVELKDVKGDLHIHSSFPIEPSHDMGQNSIEEIVNEAKRLNYEYVGFSEHNPSISKHKIRDIYDLIARRNEAIEQIKSDIKDVRIIKLLEVDILTNGDLAVNDRALNLLDCAIVSIHTSFSMDKTEMTNRVLNALSHPKAKILAHPTGRLINSRIGYDLDFEKVFDFCKEYNKALEINAYPNRLDLPDTLIRIAVEKGVKMIINTDSHEISQMNMMKYGVMMARRGWSQQRDIINTMRYEDLIKWINS